MADTAQELAAELLKVLRAVYGTVSTKPSWHRRWPRIAAAVRATIAKATEQLKTE